MVKRILLALADKSSVFKQLKRVYQRSRDRIRDFHYDHQKIDDKLIFFESFRSTKYACSPKAIYEYMLNSPDYKDFKFVWAFEHPEKYEYLRNKRTRLVKHESFAYFTAFARSKYWVVNGWVSLRARKRQSQVALQCWHGTPLKRLRYDIVDSADTGHREGAFRDNDEDMSRYDYFISPSKFASEKFISAFGLKAMGKENIMIETGYPRNDYLINFPSADIDKIKFKLSLPADKKVILYAPTWRDDQHVENEGYKYESPVDFEYLQQELSGDYIILFRAHNIVRNSLNFEKYDKFIYDVSDYDDINDLYVISDVLITDYSSVFFDYANLLRPMIFFMYDLDHYEKDLRGFYIDLDELPGDIVKTDDSIVTVLKDLYSYEQKYTEKYKAFSAKYNYLDDGRATRRVVEVMLGK